MRNFPLNPEKETKKELINQRNAISISFVIYIYIYIYKDFKFLYLVKTSIFSPA